MSPPRDARLHLRCSRKAEYHASSPINYPPGYAELSVEPLAKEVV